MGAFLKKGHMFDSLDAFFGLIIVCNGSFHYDATFWCIFEFWDLTGLRSLLFSQFSFLTISLFLGITAEFLLGWVFIGFLMDSTVEVTLGMPQQ